MFLLYYSCVDYKWNLNLSWVDLGTLLIFSLEAGRKSYREYKSYLGPWFLKQATIATECERLKEEKKTSCAPFSLPVLY